jgi:hypothetical protein
MILATKNNAPTAKPAAITVSPLPTASVIAAVAVVVSRAAEAVAVKASAGKETSSRRFMFFIMYVLFVFCFSSQHGRKGSGGGGERKSCLNHSVNCKYDISSQVRSERESKNIEIHGGIFLREHMAESSNEEPPWKFFAIMFYINKERKPGPASLREDRNRVFYYAKCLTS